MHPHKIHLDKEGDSMPFHGKLLILTTDECFCDQLRDSGSYYELLPTRDDSEAIDVYKPHRVHINVAIVDLEVQATQGEKFIEWLSQENPALPVIALTKTAGWAQISRLYKHRKLTLLWKPLTADQLVKSMASFVKTSSLDRESSAINGPHAPI